MSLCICLVGLAFFLLSLLNYKNKALNALLKYNSKFSEGPESEYKEEGTKKDDKGVIKQLTLIEKVKMGELAILEEMDREKKIEDRKKLTKIGFSQEIAQININ